MASFRAELTAMTRRRVLTTPGPTTTRGRPLNTATGKLRPRTKAATGRTHTWKSALPGSWIAASSASLPRAHHRRHRSTRPAAMRAPAASQDHGSRANTLLHLPIPVPPQVPVVRTIGGSGTILEVRHDGDVAESDAHSIAHGWLPSRPPRTEDRNQWSTGLLVPLSRVSCEPRPPGSSSVAAAPNPTETFIPAKPVSSPAEAAALCKVHVNRIRTAIAYKTLPASRDRLGLILIHRDALVAFIKAGAPMTPKDAKRSSLPTASQVTPAPEPLPVEAQLP